MSHLTRNQILATADKTLSEAEEERLKLHLNECARCRNEVAFQRAISAVAREVLQTKTSVRFTDRVMSRVLQTATNSSISYRILQNLGYVFAMMLVVGVLGYVLMNPSRFLGSQTSTQPSELAKSWDAVSSQMSQFFQRSTSQFDQALVQKTDTPSWKIILMALSILGVYGVLYRFVFQKVVRMKL